MKTVTLWLDEGLPTLRIGRGEMLARGSSLVEGNVRKDRAYQRKVAADALSLPESEIRIVVGANKVMGYPG